MAASRGGEVRSGGMDCAIAPNVLHDIRAVKRLEVCALQRRPPPRRTVVSLAAFLVPKPKSSVLVLAREPVIAALLGMLIELEGYHPYFPAAGESVDAALSRLRPPIILCADCELAEVPTDLFFARAARARARVVLFGSPAAADTVRRVAAERGVPFFLLPTDLDTLARALDDAATVAAGP